MAVAGISRKRGTEAEAGSYRWGVQCPGQKEAGREPGRGGLQLRKAQKGL